jgi:hypothetical protein
MFVPLCTAPPSNLFTPVHPAHFAESQKVPRRLIRRHAEILRPEHHHARSAFRFVQRRLTRQRKIRHPLVQASANIWPPQKLPCSLQLQRGNASLQLQHFTRSAIHSPAHIKRQFRFHAHGILRDPPARFRKQSAMRPRSRHRHRSRRNNHGRPNHPPPSA